MKQGCIKKTNNKLIVFTEPRTNRKFTVINKGEVQTTKVTVDGCQITKGIRCDYLLLSNNLEYFIELKGQDINHAVEQLGASIDQLSQAPETRISFIICRRGPMISAKLQVLQAKFKKKYRFNLIVKNSPFQYKLS